MRISKVLKIGFFIFLLFGFSNMIKAQWLSTNGPQYGGKILCLSKQGVNIFAGTQSEGIFLYNNILNNWTTLNTGLPNSFGIRINCLSANDSLLFAGTDYGVYKSFNYGLNWNLVSDSINMAIQDIALTNTKIYANTWFHLFSSSDNGQTWDSINTQGLNIMNIYKLKSIGNSIFMGTDNGLYSSSNGGITWTSSNNGIPSNLYVYSLSVFNSMLFVGTVGNPSTLYFSDNNVQNWSQGNISLINDGVYSIAVKDSQIFIGTLRKGIYYSSDLGSNWHLINDGLPVKYWDSTIYESIYSLQIDNDFIYAGTEFFALKRSLSELAGMTRNCGNNFKIYPTFINEKIYFEVDNNLNTICEIFDINGHLQDFFELKASLTQKDLSKLLNGLYLVKLTNNKFTLTKKIIIQHY